MSLALLTTALVPTFVLASNAVALSVRIRNTLISSGLAQEGVEVVRAIRDANWFRGVAFDTGLTTCAAGCAFQFDSTAPKGGVSVGTFLSLDPATGLYQYDRGTPTLFKRSVTIVPGTAPSELVVQSRVDWMERTQPKNVIIEYHLYDWMK